MYRIEKYLTPEVTENEGDVLEVSESRLELTAVSGELLDGQIRVRSRSCKEIHVFFYSNHYRMQCRVSEFIGKEGILNYRFDTRGLEVGSVEKGELCLMSETGEYRIPFVVSVHQPLAETSLGEIRNLFHFANLARENWDEAVALFYSEDFSMLFYGHDRQYYDLYRGLSGQIGNEHNVDEFLVGIHKKQKNTYSIKEKGLLLKEEGAVFSTDTGTESLTVVCSGWGYMHAQISAKGEFIRLHTTCVNTEDFYENECQVLFSVQRSWLKNGSNIGSVVVTYEGGSVEVPIIVEVPGAVSKKTEEKRESRQLMVQLMRDYIACVTSNTDRQQCLEAAEKTTEKINSRYGRNLFARLCQMHILMEQGRISEARWVLSHVEKTQKQDEMEPMHYGYYLYLRALLEENDSFTRSVKQHLYKLCEMQPEDSFLACMYVRMVTDELSAQERLAIYEQQYRTGCRNPVLFREAFSVFEESLAYLSGLDEFEVSVLSFAVRYGLYTQETAQRVADLVMRRKELSPQLLRFLRRSYEMYPEDAMLQAICTLMIRCGMCMPECFEWYERALRKNLRITSLYEYYMMASDTRRDKLPPRAVLMYFAYHCDLDDRRKAYLFSLLVKHREEIPELFRQYEETIAVFALASMERGMISKNLAVLYRYMLNESDRKIPHDQIQKIAFRHLISVESDEVVNVIIVQEQLKGEKVYPVEKRRAYVDCYTSEYVVLLEDAHGNRLCDKSRFTDMKLMAVEKLAMYLEEQASESVGFLMYRTHICGNPEQAPMSLLPIYEKLTLSAEVDDGYRRELCNTLLRMYFDREEYDRMEVLLEQYDVHGATVNERAELVRYLVYLEKDEQALNILYQYGFENVSAKSLARLIGRMLEAGNGFDDKRMALVYYTFRLGKYTQDMLLYLCRYFEGTLKQMREVWKACVSFDVDASAVAERILQAYLFSHGYLAGIGDVFDYYVSHRRRDSVVKCYIQDMAYRYFVKQQPAQPGIFRVLEELFSSGYEMDRESRAAYLYYMSTEVPDYSERQKKLITSLVNDMMAEKQYVPFFAKFAEFIPWLLPYTELTYLEYRTSPGSQVTLHYVHEGEGQQYMRIRLEEICAGYYCRNFVLFFGERLQYYFMEQQGSERMLTESGFLEKSDMTGEEAESRYGLLNDILMCEALGDDRTKRDLVRKYKTRSLVTEKLFGDC